MSIFNSKNNRCKLIGFLVSDITQSKDYENVIEFKLRVNRPLVSNKPQYYDEFIIYVSDRQNVSICKECLKRGRGAEVKGEMRSWFDGTIRLCASEIKPIY